MKKLAEKFTQIKISREEMKQIKGGDWLDIQCFNDCMAWCTRSYPECYGQCTTACTHYD